MRVIYACRYAPGVLEAQEGSFTYITQEPYGAYRDYSWSKIFSMHLIPTQQVNDI